MSIKEPNPYCLHLQQGLTVTAEESTYKPVILNINRRSDFKYFNIISKTAIISDTIYGQLKELLKKRNPKSRFSEEEYAWLIRDYLNGISIKKYGLWVYYPWSGKLIHIVNEDEFIELRTIRNCYKITPEEQAGLKTKIIGIVGLSAGHAVALTIASERICGEMRLADFDELELTNLNRIKTGIQNIGLKKTIITAREIAEIDPFIKVKCFHDGINDNNILCFLKGEDQIDLCVEECDDFYIKFSMRFKCKDLGIPVLMATSDSGLIDIERFDLQKEAKIFHGLSTTTNIESLRNLSTDQKIPYLYEIVNENDMSVRLRASLIEIGESITGWPQLSSAVTCGGGMATDVARRILLGHLKQSGRFSADIEKIVADDLRGESVNHPVEKFNPPIDVQRIQTIPKSSRSIIDRNIIENIVADAIAAPSPGNSQPWKWIAAENSLIAVLDKKRIASNTDFNNWGSVLSLGCSVENAILSANKHGFHVALKILEAGENDFAAELNLSKKSGENDENIYDGQLASYIKSRQTNRKNSQYKSLAEEHKKQLTEAVHSIPEAGIKFIEKWEDINKISELIAAGDIIRFLNKFLYHELMNEIRWNKNDAIIKPYGIEIDSLEISPKDKIGLKVFSSWEVASLVKKFGGKALGDISRRQILASSALVLITMPVLNKDNFFMGGRAVERFWLTATKCNLAIHPFAALIYFFMRLGMDATTCFDEKEIQELKNLRRQWEEIFGPSGEVAEMFLCRVFYSERSKENSGRLPLSKMLEFTR
ncbi:MAG: Rv1355c family protein [Ferruginibacter sp.]